MNGVGQPERATQNRVIALFRDELGYRYLGDWTDRDGNSNIEEGLLTAWLTKSGYTPAQISAALYKLRTEADNHNRSLYGNNQAVYNLLRYGVPVKIEAGKVTETVHLINWNEPEKNDFAIAEEVTLKGNHERRPDLVLYVNGIAIGVLELKNSRVTIGDGIRQSLSNQQPEFNEWFFSTVQFIFAGNDSEGLQYGTIGTPEKYFLKWKEDEAGQQPLQAGQVSAQDVRQGPADRADARLRALRRRHEEAAARAPVFRHQGRAAACARDARAASSGTRRAAARASSWCCWPSGFWRTTPTPASPSSPTATSWTNRSRASSPRRGEAIKRTSSGRDLMNQLGQAKPRLLCSLVHKFGRRDVDDFDAFIKELEAQPSPTVGEVFVFVDECHRTQSGKLHRVMKAMMPNAVFIGFTGTPLLEEGQADQPGSLRRLHPHLQVQRGRGGRGGARPRL